MGKFFGGCAKKGINNQDKNKKLNCIGSQIIMKNKESTIMFVPARAGSKGIKNKNIAQVGGVPLIVNAVGTAMSSGYETIFSSDSSAYTKIIENNYNCKTLRRRKIHATDNSDVWDCVLDYHTSNNSKEAIIYILLEPTSPFILTSDILDIETRMKENPSILYMTNVCKTPATHNRINQRRKANSDKEEIEFIYDQRYKIIAKQEYEDTYCFGNLHAIRSDFLEKRNIPKRMPRLVIPQIRAISIDYPEDLLVAKAIAKGCEGDLKKKLQLLKEEYMQKALTIF